MAPTVSASQLAAQEVLAGKATVARSVNTDFDALGAALGRGAGVPGNPIVVTLNERECRSCLFVNCVPLSPHLPIKCTVGHCRRRGMTIVPHWVHTRNRRGALTATLYMLPLRVIVDLPQIYSEGRRISTSSEVHSIRWPCCIL